MSSSVHRLTPAARVSAWPLHHPGVSLTTERVDTSKAKQALSDAERVLGTARSDVEKHRSDLSRIFDPTWFGKDGEFKKLDGTCLEKESGE